MVLAHTRELAFQISKEYERFSKYNNNIKIAVFFGGMNIKKDEEVLSKNCPHIVVATPGRLLALVRSKALSLKNVKHFILDECDKMLAALGEFILEVSALFTPRIYNLRSDASPPKLTSLFQEIETHFLVFYSNCYIGEIYC